MKRLCIILLLSISSSAAMAQEPKVYVFLPSNIRPHVMKQILSKACPGIDFTVFGRFREFEARIKDAPPDAILSLEPVITRQQGAKPLLQGQANGKVSETYVFLSRGENVNLDQLSDRVIGVVDLLGRSQMDKFLKDKLNVQDIKRIRTVTKLEDLLSLLQFEDADAILVPESKIEYYRGRTQLTLEVTRLQDLVIGLPVVATLKDDSNVVKTITQALQSAGANLDKTLGVEQWVRP